MRRAARAVLAALLIAAALLGAAGTATADPFTTPSTDPISDDYNPHSWLLAWDPVVQADAVKAVVEGDAHAGMDQTGLTVATQPAQWAALTAADRMQLTAAWGDGLLAKTWTRTQQMFHAANNNDLTAIPWSAADSDSAARDLGASSYGALSPGLKSVVQRIATIVTGEYKPAMPDDAWAAWMPADVRAAFDARPVKLFDYRSVTIGGRIPSSGIITQCDAGIINWACEGTRAVAETAGEVAGWATDPLGELTGLMAAGTAGLMSWVATEASEATTPDLTGEWWINAYSTGMAIGIILLGFVLLWQLIQKARGAIDSRDLVESFVVWGPAYFAGIVFGPPLAQFMIVGSSALTDGIAQALTGYSAADAADEVQSALDGAAAGTVVGGSIIAFFILLITALAALMVFISLCAQTVAVYLSSAVFAIAFAWVVSSRQRGGSMKIPLLFMGLVFSRPLLFFLLGVGLGYSRKAITNVDDPTRNLATLVITAFILLIAGFAPMLLLKYAPISPTGMGTGGNGNGVSAAGLGAAAAAGGSKLAGLANVRASYRAAKGAGGAGAARASGGGSSAGGGGALAGAAAGGSAAAGAGAGSSVIARAAKPGSVAQRLNRAPRSTGGVPSARAAALGAKVPSPHSSPTTPGAGAAKAPAATRNTGGTSPAAAAPSTARASSPVPTAPATPRPTAGPARPGTSAGVTTKSGSATSGAAARRRTPPPAGRPAGGHLSAAAREVTDGLDGDQKWDNR